ncbi:DUF1259 domain-containing protein [Streptomyces sp. NBC_01136]|uniref:DUF1259 domain-containing protein n=1 Tax=unclassified Streptomyces TaxID=2593676 RepID=UPI00324F972D|nr:DUF1259 domain-containing protein [Streptomyces sp. NBC_01136]
MTAPEVQRVIQALRKGNIDIVELHNHALNDQPRLFCMHFWATADGVTLATALRPPWTPPTSSRPPPDAPTDPIEREGGGTVLTYGHLLYGATLTAIAEAALMLLVPRRRRPGLIATTAAIGFLAPFGRQVVLKVTGRCVTSPPGGWVLTSLAIQCNHGCTELL